VAETARKLGILVIADEVYDHLTFGSNPFVPMGVFGSLIPVITLGSISKRWIVPGWRIGWLVTNDTQGILQQSGVIPVFHFIFAILFRSIKSFSWESYIWNRLHNFSFELDSPLSVGLLRVHWAIVILLSHASPCFIRLLEVSRASSTSLLTLQLSFRSL